MWKDKSRVTLTADKGVAMVVLDRQGYLNKDQDLLWTRIPTDFLQGIPLPNTKTNSSKFSGLLALKVD